MKKPISLFLLIILVLMMIGCTGKGEQKSPQTSDPIQKEMEQSRTENETQVTPEEVKPLRPEEVFDKVYDYFAAGKPKKRIALSLEAAYYVGIDKEEHIISFMYASEDHTQGVVLELDRAGNLNVLVNIKSLNEGVIGTATIKAADYYYGYEFSDFTYQSEKTNWSYDNFKIRANAYIRDTLIYAEHILKDYVDVDLASLGFASWESPGFFLEGMFGPDDVAGMWDYKSRSSNEYSNRLFLVGDKAYWRGYEESYASAMTSDALTESDEFLLGTDMVIGVYDFFTGEMVIVTDYATDDEDQYNQFRHYVYRDADRNLCMRVESVYGGLSDREDGKVYTKIENDREVKLTARTYDPTKGGKEELDFGTHTSEESKTESSTSTTQSSGSYSTEGGTYQTILDEYTQKMEKATPGLVAAYERESAGITDIDRLAKICNKQVEKLAEICNEGVGKMAELMFEQGDSYETYERWTGKLMDVYMDLSDEIMNVYLNSDFY